MERELLDLQQVRGIVIQVQAGAFRELAVGALLLAPGAGLLPTRALG